MIAKQDQQTHRATFSFTNPTLIPGTWITRNPFRTCISMQTSSEFSFCVYEEAYPPVYPVYTHDAHVAAVDKCVSAPLTFALFLQS